MCHSLSLMSFIPFLLLLFVTSGRTIELNVGTTLFTKADSFKECWSSENMALLTSRMILEDLLPSTSILVIDSNEFVTDLVEYFRLILEIVRHETHGKTKHLTLLALTDLLGIVPRSFSVVSRVFSRRLFTPCRSPNRQICLLCRFD